ncbi:MAG: metallophosphoesterase family protein [Nitrosopumilus sp.]
MISRRSETYSSIENRLIELPPKGKAVFVGDTHGDLEASKKVISEYLKDDNKIIFLGDYVDRGKHSKENIDYLLKLREENPNVILLQGNHEGYTLIQFNPADFWESLNSESIKKYASLFYELPLAVHCNGLIAVHGALPDVERLEDIAKISLIKDKNHWKSIVWGDWVNYGGRSLGEQSGRPQFGQDYFNELMDRFGSNVLIRSHQPRTAERIYDDRCLTIFTSEAYGRKRTIAIADLTKPIESLDNLKIIDIDYNQNSL